MSEPVDVDAIRARADAVAHGGALPWSVHHSPAQRAYHVRDAAHEWVAQFVTDAATADFIAHACSDVGALLAALAAAVQRADTAEAAIREAREVIARTLDGGERNPRWRNQAWTLAQRVAAALSSPPS